MGYKENETVVIVGAGISGLACAYRLKQLGVHSVVLEATGRAGGLISTVRSNGFLFEVGPQCARFAPSVWGLVREVKLEGEFVAGNPRAKRYIYRYGRLHPAPFSLSDLMTTRLVGLASKFRILSEGFTRSRPPEDEETLAQFVERKFGPEVLHNLADPIVSTVFFGDCREMGMQSAFPALVQWERKDGSVVRGAIRARNSRRSTSRQNGWPPRPQPKANRGILRVTDALPVLGSFRSGMAALPERLAEGLNSDIRYRAGITFVKPSTNENSQSKSAWQVGLQSGERIVADRLVLAVPAYVAAELLSKSVPRLASLLRAIQYAPLSGVSSVFARSEVANPLDGFGFMVPQKEGLRTICTFWNSSLFRLRAPEGKVLITSYARREEVGDKGQEGWGKAVEAENARALGIRGAPLERLAWKEPRALPQYKVGHAHRIAEIRSILRSLPNLYLSGNFLAGRSISECVEVAFGVAEDLHSHLRDTHI